MSTRVPRSTSLPDTPDLANLKKRAKQLVRAHRAGESEAMREIAVFLPRLSSASEEQIAGSRFTLSDAQLVLARRYGFASWPKLKAHVEAVASEQTPESARAPGRSELPDPSADVPVVLPMLPARGFVALPGMLIPLRVGRRKAVRAVDRALEESRLMFQGTQRDRSVKEPRQEDLYEIGTLAHLEETERSTDGTVKLLMAVRRRARLEAFLEGDAYEARVSALVEADGSPDGGGLVAEVRSAFERYAERVGLVSREAVLAAQRATPPGRLADCVAGSVRAGVADKQAFLACLPPVERLRLVRRWLSEHAASEGSR